MELVIAIAICVALAVSVIALRGRNKRERSQLEVHQITAEELRKRIDSGREVLVFDIRQPLDLLANSDIIPGAKRIPPKELLANPSLIPKEKESVIYCT